MKTKLKYLAIAFMASTPFIMLSGIFKGWQMTLVVYGTVWLGATVYYFHATRNLKGR